ncbi:No apical meristem (NAM) protein [Corchorus olitorius]|uniref:No apical meristem (NAM) protein n=1 Tax=Corchorus olitorius TaxID=93759 RepID=A0A1R3HG59_9ROSI|nr:No apical meristem (NAM) protein [Corchorus olitorius]
MVVVSDSNLSIPIGFRFHPTKEEILISYLRSAIKREPLPANVLMKIDIYGDKKQPWNLFDKDSSDTYWIFTMLKKKSGSRIDRVAGCGCWLNQSFKKIKDSGGKLLGFEKSFTFTCKNKCCGRANNINGNWIMHEYSLADKGLSEYVICEIKNKDAVNKKRKGGHEDIDDDDGGMLITKKVCVDHTQTMVINSCSPQQGDGQLEFTTNGSVCLALNDINEEMNLKETSANTCDWNEFSSELEDLLVCANTSTTGSSSFPTTTYAVNSGYGEPYYGQENYQMNNYNEENNHNFGGFGHQGTNNPIFMDRTQSQTIMINSCSPQQGDGDEAFDQPEFTTNGSVSFTVNDNNEAINLEASADACDYWNKLFSELED